jgi:hypothetical protein
MNRNRGGLTRRRRAEHYDVPNAAGRIVQPCYKRNMANEVNGKE